MLPILFSFALATAAAAPPVAAETPVTQIRVDFRWGGLGDPVNETFVITAKGATFSGAGQSVTRPQLRGGTDKREVLRSETISGAEVAALERQLKAPPVPFSKLLDQLASKEWLERNASVQYLAKFHDGNKPCSPEAEALFMRRFTSQETARQALKRYFEGQWTDDYPGARVELTFADGRRVVAHSNSQKFLMLPWESAGSETWSPALARAIAAVLPSNSHLRQRLEHGEKHFAEEYSQAVVPPFDEEWADLESRCRHRDLVARVARQFEVLSVYTPMPDVFGAKVRRHDLPPNLSIAMVVSRKSKRDTEREMLAFEAKIEKYLGLTIPYARSHPAQLLELQFYHGVSLSEFDIDIRADESDAKRLRKIKDDVAVLWNPDTRKTEYWALLPSGEVLHWE